MFLQTDGLKIGPAKIGMGSSRRIEMGVIEKTEVKQKTSRLSSGNIIT